MAMTPEKLAAMTDDDNLLVVKGTAADSLKLYGEWTLGSNVTYNGEVYAQVLGANGAKLYYATAITMKEMVMVTITVMMLKWRVVAVG